MLLKYILEALPLHRTWQIDVASWPCGVPQSSVLGPMLFTLCLLHLGQTVNHFDGISYRLYADDIHLYLYSSILFHWVHWLSEHFV